MWRMEAAWAIRASRTIGFPDYSGAAARDDSSTFCLIQTPCLAVPPEPDANYYTRVPHIPMLRHSLLDSIAPGLDFQEINRPATIQERIYSSPIRFSP